MNIDYPDFGRVVIDGRTFDHDIIIEGGDIRARDKRPSRHRKGEFGHTPLTGDEDIPWSGETLIIGTGYSGRLPVLPEIGDIAESKGVEIQIMPTSRACEVLADLDKSEVRAVLHVTC